MSCHPSLQHLRMAARVSCLAHLRLGIAHDLKGPLNTMAVNLELLRCSVHSNEGGPEVAASRERWLSVIEDEIRRLDGAIGRVTAAIGGDAAGDLWAQVRDLNALVAAQCRRQRVEISVDLPAAPVPSVQGAPELYQALLDLLVNALEAMPGGGRLEIRGAVEGGPIARLTIDDSGTGLPQVPADRLFEPGFSTKPERAGLGLYLAREAMAGVGGALTLESRNGGGTRASVEIPIHG